MQEIILAVWNTVEALEVHARSSILGWFEHFFDCIHISEVFGVWGRVLAFSLEP